MRPSSPGLSARLRARRRRARAPTWSRSGSAPPTSCTSPPATSTCPARCSPPATTRRSTTASRCAAPAPRRSARTPAWPRSATWPRGNSPTPAPPASRRTSPARSPSGTCSPPTPRTCATWSTSASIRPLKVVVDAGNGMGGHTVPTVFARPAARPRPDVLRARRHLPEPRGQPARPEEPGRPAGQGRRGRRRPRPRLRRRRRPLLRRRRDAASRSPPSAITALVAARELAKHPGADDHPQPDHLQAVPEIVREHGGVPVRTRVGHSFIKAGDGRAPARSSAASTPRTTTSATSGAPTPACWPRCTCWPPSAGRSGRCPS